LRELLVEYEHRCGSIIGTYEGQVANRFDTELRVHFGYPIAYENDAVRAIIAGLHIVDAIRRLQSEFPQLSCLSGESLFAVRVGIHTGQVVAGDSNPLTYNSIVGATGGVAARIQRIAATNAVVISEQTYQLVHGFFEVRYLGETRIPGLAKPLGLFDVVGKTSAEDRIQAATQLPS
jgi:class 3 adenylate cyclase